MRVVYTLPRRAEFHGETADEIVSQMRAEAGKWLQTESDSQYMQIISRLAKKWNGSYVCTLNALAFLYDMECASLLNIYHGEKRIALINPVYTENGEIANEPNASPVESPATLLRLWQQLESGQDDGPVS